MTNKSRLLPGSFKISNVGLTVVHSVFSDLSLRSSSWGANLIIFYKSVNCGLEMISLLIGQNQYSSFSFLSLLFTSVIYKSALFYITGPWCSCPAIEVGFQSRLTTGPSVTNGFLRFKLVQDGSATIRPRVTHALWHSDSFRLHHRKTLR